MGDNGVTELTATVQPPPDGSLNAFSISTQFPDANGVIVTCNGLMGNQPKTNRNTVALWDTLAPRPENKPLAVFPVPDDNQPNSFPLSYQLSAIDYALSYQTGESLTTICSITPLLLFPKMMGWASRVALSIRRISTVSIDIQYTVLPGYQPSKYGNWIGLWQGDQIAYGAADPVGKANVASVQSQGIVTLGGLALDSGFSYTIFYFMASSADDPAGTTAGAVLYFST